jgi:hypothetical protein
MGKYLLAYRGGAMARTEAEQQAQMAAWGDWFGKLGSAVSDMGAPFAGSAAVSSSGAVNDGVTSGLSGYSVVEADSLSAATDYAKECPLLSDGGAIDVYEAHSMA